MNDHDLALAVDLGSTTAKAALVTTTGTIEAIASVEAPPLTADGGFDAERYVDAALAAATAAVGEVDGAAERTVALSVSSQRGTVVAVGEDGRATAPAVSWQSLACAPAAERLFAALGHRFGEITGLSPSPLYTAAKLAGLRDGAGAVYRSAARFVLLHDYFLARLGADTFTTDPSNASVTGLLDRARGDWSPEILEALELAADRLPALAPAGTRVGGLAAAMAERIGLRTDTALVVGGGDQQCAALGAGAHEPGVVVLSLGTAASVVATTRGLVPGVVAGLVNGAHMIPGQGVLEGFESAFGASLGWAVGALGTTDVAGLERLATSATSRDEEVVFLPFLSGIGSPDFDARTRGAFFGLSLTTSPADLARAVFEGLAFENARVLRTVADHVEIDRVRAVGGLVHAPLLMTLLAAAGATEIGVSGTTEAAILGAAAAAFTGADRFPDLTAAAAAVDRGVDTVVVPSPEALGARQDAYLRAVGTIRGHHAGDGP